MGRRLDSPRRSRPKTLGYRSPPGYLVRTLPTLCTGLESDEGIWHYLKNVELRNMCIDTLPQLRTAIHQAATRIRQKTHVITACFQKAELTL